MVNLNTDNIVDEFKNKAEAVLASFMTHISSISPNKVDMNKIRALNISGKTVRDYEKSGMIIVNMNGPRSVKIESLDALNTPKLYKPLTTALIEAGMNVVENGGIMNATLQQLTEDMRKEIAKQIRQTKENYKQNINNLRSDLHKAIKGMKISEDLQNKLKNDIDKLKDKIQKSLDTECANKEKAVMNG